METEVIERTVYICECGEEYSELNDAQECCGEVEVEEREEYECGNCSSVYDSYEGAEECTNCHFIEE